MKRNRNDFEEITNEIGNLMESIIQYAKQHETVSQRFAGLCDGFLRCICSPLWCATRLADPKPLSVMSSMQSEMEQLFGAPMKYFARAKAYKHILSSYYFRIRCLHSDLQVPTENRL